MTDQYQIQMELCKILLHDESFFKTSEMKQKIEKLQDELKQLRSDIYGRPSDARAEIPE